jgi:hypothetical protein
MMASSRTFSGVTVEVLTRMQEFGRAKYGIIYDPPEGLARTATARTPFGECVIATVYQEDTAELTLTLLKKPWLLPEGLLWNGFVETLARCRAPGDPKRAA